MRTIKRLTWWSRHDEAGSGTRSLRAYLLVPLTVVTVAALIVLGSSVDLVSHWQEERDIAERGNTALATTLERVAASEQSLTTLTRVIASEEELSGLVERGDLAASARRARWFLDATEVTSLAVVTANGEDVLRVGRYHQAEETAIVARAVREGGVHTTTVATREGVALLAAAPLAGAAGDLGTVVVGRDVGADALRAWRAQPMVDLAVFRDGQLVSQTVDEAGMRVLLQVAHAAGPDGAAIAGDGLDERGLRTWEAPLDDGGTLMVLVPIGDLRAAADLRHLVLLVGTLAVAALVTLAGLVVARGLTGTLRKVSEALAEMLEGNYQRRCGDSSLRDVYEIGDSINRLAEQVELQVGELVSQAFYDPLTNLPNRVLFMDRLNHALTRAKRDRSRLAVMFLDVDNFKLVNDSLGHQVGDQFLVQLAEHLGESVRAGDTVARLSGDEFAILLEEIDDERDAFRVADRIKRRLRTPFRLDGHDVFAAVSIGFSTSTGGKISSGDLLRQADLAMYQAKLGGKGRCVAFDRHMSSMVADRLALETDLRRALERGEFRVFYQPIVQLDSGSVGEVEALVRWSHPQRGLVAPGEFIGLAEETGLIVPIGQWVLKEACRQVRAWEQDFGSSIILSVNLSARQFQQEDLTEEIEQILAETGMSPSHLKLEVTESVMVQNLEGAISTLQRLKETGIRVAIDDFGTGYSSLGQLKRLPIDVLKIDRSFVDGITVGTADAAIVRSIIELASTLNLGVTGEGIETAEQLAVLRALGCRHGQGYFLAKPLPSSAMSALLADGSPLLPERSHPEGELPQVA